MALRILDFGNPRIGTRGWVLDLNVTIQKRRGYKWSPTELAVFWEKFVGLMTKYGVTNDYPKAPDTSLIRDQNFKPEEVVTEKSNVALSAVWTIGVLTGKWSEEECMRFRDEASVLIKHEGLVLKENELPVAWVLIPSEKVS